MAPHHHFPDDVLLEYGAGLLPEAMALLVACHATMCPDCRREIAFVEQVGGGELEIVAPAALGADALDATMARLDAAAGERGEPSPPVPTAPRPGGRRPGAVLPGPLLAYLPQGRAAGARLDQLDWRWLGPGLSAADLKVGTTREIRTRLIRLDGGRAAPRHTHRGHEALMVLSGGYSDETGDYRRGDVAVASPDIVHRPVAHEGEPCLCLTVLDAPISLVGAFSHLLNPFIRF